jgi:hypothetical protein
MVKRQERNLNANRVPLARGTRPSVCGAGSGVTPLLPPERIISPASHAFYQLRAFVPSCPSDGGILCLHDLKEANSSFSPFWRSVLRLVIGLRRIGSGAGSWQSSLQGNPWSEMFLWMPIRLPAVSA